MIGPGPITSPPGGDAGAPTGVGAGGPNGMAEIVIAGGTEETRILLRGLVRLHRHQVVAEGTGVEVLANLPKSPAPRLVLVDVDLEQDGWGSGIADAWRDHPDLRIILIARSRSPRLEARAKELGVAVLLRSPFAIHELVDAISPKSPA
jgi:CheY-like chemotaxis protein